MNGAFTDSARVAVLESHHGMCVGGCGQRAVHVHHRDARGMGGTRRAEYGQPPNGLPVCARLHGWIETHPNQARALGWMTDGVTNEPYWSPVWGSWMRWRHEPDPPTWLTQTTEGHPNRVAFTHP